MLSLSIHNNNTFNSIVGAVAAISCITLVISIYYFYVPGPWILAETGTNIWISLLLLSISVLLQFRQASIRVHLFCLAIAGLQVITSIGVALFGRLDISLYAMFTVAFASMGYLRFNEVSKVPKDLKTNSVKLTDSVKATNCYSTSPSAGPNISVVQSFVLALLSCFAVVVAFLLALGAVIQGCGVVIYPPRGTFLSIDGAESTHLRILYHCEGPHRNNSPVFVLDADASHGLADFWPLQRAMTRFGLRSCIFDKPGLGQSSYYHLRQHYAVSSNYSAGFMPYYRNFFKQLHEKEQNKFILVGWGGGGENVYAYTLNESKYVHGLAFLDTYGANVEWRSVAHVDNMTTDQMNKYKASDLQQRQWTFLLIRLVGAPFGLLQFFLPGNKSTYAMPERFAEYHWNYLVPKTWTTQWFTLRPLFTTNITKSDRGVFDITNQHLDGLPILQVFSDPPKSTICQNLTAKECTRAWDMQRFMIEDRVFVANVTKNAAFYRCSLPECSLEMPLRMPEFVARALKVSWKV